MTKKVSILIRERDDWKQVADALRARNQTLEEKNFQLLKACRCVVKWLEETKGEWKSLGALTALRELQQVIKLNEEP